jgi:hypothetical protein
MPLPATCPQCGADLERGFIAGQGMFLNWLPQGSAQGWTTLGKEHLATGALARSPRLVAARCATCSIGLFEW